MPDPSRDYIIHAIRLPNGDRCVLKSNYNNVVYGTFDVNQIAYQTNKRVSISASNYELVDGSIVCVDFIVSGPSGSILANSKLKVGSSDEKIIHYRGEVISSLMKAPASAVFVYDQSEDCWNMVSYDPDGYEVLSNKLSSSDHLTSNSTDRQYPSAKLMYDIIGDVETLLANI